MKQQRRFLRKEIDFFKFQLRLIEVTVWWSRIIHDIIALMKSHPRVLKTHKYLPESNTVTYFQKDLIDADM